MKKMIAGIGEILWDVLPDSEKLGGAPINFAYHATALGAEGVAISSVGDDSRGHLALKQLNENGVATTDITVLPGTITGYVSAQIDSEGVASYHFPDNVAWDQITLSEKTLAKASHMDAVCFGSLAQRSLVSRKAIYAFLDQLRPECIKVFDLNIRQQFYSDEIIEDSLKHADVLKLNDDEITLLQKKERLSGPIDEQLKTILEKYRLQLIVLTRGNKGSLLVSKNVVSNHPGYQTKIVDTIGAGDSFTAAVALGLLQGNTLEQINEHANQLAAFVCSQKGAMPVVPEHFRSV